MPPAPLITFKMIIFIHLLLLVGFIISVRFRYLHKRNISFFDKLSNSKLENYNILSSLYITFYVIYIISLFI